MTALAARLSVITALALLTSCGSDGKKGGQAPVPSKELHQGPPPVAPSPDDKNGYDQFGPLPPQHALVGLYSQVENRQAKIRIDQNLLIETNLEIPVQTGAGPVRITPRFPHQLRPNADGSYFGTEGFFNDGRSLFLNIEIQLVLYAEGRLLDVTLITKDAGGSVTQPGSGNLGSLDHWWYDCGPHFLPHPCDPCGPGFIPCFPCCDPCPGPPCPRDPPRLIPGGEHPRIQFRFERDE